jgi:uncharacterized membrane protein YqgA involved in biofilm formation
LIGLGTIINTVTVLLGGAIGAMAGHRMRESTRHLTTDVLGLVTGMNAVMAAAAVVSVKLTHSVGTTWPLFIVLFSLLFGGIIGSLLRIEDRLEGIGDWLRNRFAKEDSQFVAGFVSASLVFCIGPLAIMGSFDDAMGLGLDKLLLKSTLDFFAAIAFASSLGWGVAASALAVGLYQGLLTLLGFGLGQIWDEAQLAGMTAVGGLLLLGISFKLLDIKKIAIGDLLPALFIAPVVVSIISQLQ